MNNASFVDQESDWNDRHFEEVERVNNHWPRHLLPLHKELSAIWVLLLDDTEDDQIAALLCFKCLCVPHGHVPATTRSPRGKDVKDDLLSPETCDGHW